MLTLYCLKGSFDNIHALGGMFSGIFLKRRDGEVIFSNVLLEGEFLKCIIICYFRCVCMCMYVYVCLFHYLYFPLASHFVITTYEVHLIKRSRPCGDFPHLDFFVILFEAYSSITHFGRVESILARNLVVSCLIKGTRIFNKDPTIILSLMEVSVNTLWSLCINASYGETCRVEFL